MTETETIRHLLELATGDDQVELRRAVNWVAKALKREQDKPTKAAIADHSAARDNLRSVVARLVPLYLPDQVPEPVERFKTRQEALDWVRAQGGTVSRGKFYKDAKKGGYRVYPDKTVSKASVAEYVLRLKDAAPAVDLVLVDYSQERQRLEVRKLGLEVERLEIATRSADRDWVRAEDHWAHLAGALVLCKGSLEHHARMAASEIVALAGGDYHLAPQVADRIVEAVINRAFNEVAVQPIDHGRFETIEIEPGAVPRQETPIQ